MLTTSLNLAEKYNYLEERFKEAFKFLRNTNLEILPLGRVDICGDELFANVQEYMTMEESECKYEAHNQYYDIQYVVSGIERFGYVSREGLEEETEYNEEQDLIFYKEPELSGNIVLKAGDFAIVPPEDAHKPRCMAGKPCKVRKIVIKVRV